MKSQSHLLAYSIPNLIASNLHKNGKVCKVITRTRYFIVDFFDQRASCLRPIPIYVGSTIIERKQRKTIQNTVYCNNQKVSLLRVQQRKGSEHRCTFRIYLWSEAIWGSTTRNKVCFETYFNIKSQKTQCGVTSSSASQKFTVNN